YLEHHRGLTHSFLGLALLAVALTALLVFLDRVVRLRRDPFRRPIRPVRIMALAFLGGLGHLFMDFTNSYGVRPFLPFSSRWFYGDLAFVVDPWIWLILGSTAAWLTMKDAARATFWIALGAGASLLIALAFREPTQDFPVAIPVITRVIWFIGLAVVVTGALRGWARGGARLAQLSLLVLSIYYAGMWFAHQTAVQGASTAPPADGAGLIAAWPTPANPFMWQTVASADRSIYSRYMNLLSPEGEWSELSALDPKFTDALRRDERARVFLSFTRYASARVDEHSDGARITLRDLRFNLQMVAELDSNSDVRSAVVGWF
ncbi:MAG TPA: metal-dependent hydrolase, partial [Blastocatellia bacterium]|nr:metal-dependent hydrolase [Blastocatellia bacterium]